MIRIVEFKTITEYEAFLSETIQKSNDLVYITGTKTYYLATNNVSGEYAIYNGTFEQLWANEDIPLSLREDIAKHHLSLQPQKSSGDLDETLKGILGTYTEEQVFEKSLTAGTKLDYYVYPKETIPANEKIKVVVNCEEGSLIYPISVIAGDKTQPSPTTGTGNGCIKNTDGGELYRLYENVPQEASYVGEIDKLRITVPAGNVRKSSVITVHIYREIQCKTVNDSLTKLNNEVFGEDAPTHEDGFSFTQGTAIGSTNSIVYLNKDKSVVVKGTKIRVQFDFPDGSFYQNNETYNYLDFYVNNGTTKVLVDKGTDFGQRTTSDKGIPCYRYREYEITCSSSDIDRITFYRTSSKVYKTGEVKVTITIGDDMYSLRETLEELNEEFQLVKTPQVYLASDYYVAKGDELRIYHRNVVQDPLVEQFNVNLICSVGNAYPNYYTLDTKSISAGDYKITLKVKDRYNNLLASKQSTIHVVNKISNPSSTKNILVIGASTYANGAMIYELIRRLTKTTGTEGDHTNPKGWGLTNFKSIGRITPNITEFNSERLEAIGGRTSTDYAEKGNTSYRGNVSGVNLINLYETYSDGTNTFKVIETNITNGSGYILLRAEVDGTTLSTSTTTLTRVSGSGDATISISSITEESGNPFWNLSTNKLDFKNYSTTYCSGASMDVVILGLGHNDMAGGNKDNDYILANYDAITNAIHTDYPNAIILIHTLQLPDQRGGLGKSYGASVERYNVYDRNLRYWSWGKAVEEHFKGSTYVHVIDGIAPFDSMNLFAVNDKEVNPRSSITEKVGINGLHFDANGYNNGGASYGGSKTIADFMLGAICAKL